MDLLLLLLLLLPLLWRGTISQNADHGIHVPASVTVQEGLCVSIPCSFYYPQRYRNNKTVHGYWYYHGYWNKRYLVATSDGQVKADPWAGGRFLLAGDPRRDSCSLHLIGAQKGDAGTYSFRVQKDNMAYSYTQKMVSIQVADLTQRPEIHLPQVLRAGLPVNLTCTVPGACRGGTAIAFLWTGTALSASPALSAPRLLFTPKPQDHGTSLTCEATFRDLGVTTRTTAQLSVLYPPQAMKIVASVGNGTGSALPRNASSLVVLEGGSVTLACSSHSKPPATLSWARGHHVLNSSHSPGAGVLHLELSHLGGEAGGEYTCHARNPLGSQSYSVRLCVQTLTQRPELQVPEILERGKPVTLTCLVPGLCRQGKHFSFLWSGPALSSRGPAPLNTSRLLLVPHAQDHSTNVTCRVVFPQARVSLERTVRLTVIYPPQNVTVHVSRANRTGLELLGNTSSLQALEGESLTLVCATKSNPPAALLWAYRDQVLRAPEGSDAGILPLELPRLSPKDRGEYTCRAQHPLGAQQHTVKLCVQTCSCCPVSEEEDGSWPLIFTLLRGALMGVGFLLTYGLTWLYYTCRVSQPPDTTDKSEPIGIYSVPEWYGSLDVPKLETCGKKSQ
ncbi:sialic acid-binding Ig-like lectin 14 [Antechinus flavipes]|uniref:sialic acid-binding Ig-like lectin 14 n=1 Tax=Antechinus flavipes TaxID=38775 RepID=UPI002235AEA9|nr:sialic acid-binding Ig-like lectin 14 [Antechinus flavipes]XP_051845502.1 sialic acid-binding Ig-like lectin 14 [Antechinus flavipes]